MRLKCPENAHHGCVADSCGRLLERLREAVQQDRRLRDDPHVGSAEGPQSTYSCNHIRLCPLTVLTTTDALRVLQQFKVLAIKPILEQLMDDATYDGLMSNSIPYHEYIAVNKLVTWVQQVESCTSVTVLGNGVTVSLFSRNSSLRCP
jgi:hypothetical protein